MELRDFDVSTRVNLASSAICDDREATVVLKLDMAAESSSAAKVVLEFNEEELKLLVSKLSAIRKVEDLIRFNCGRAAAWITDLYLLRCSCYLSGVAHVRAIAAATLATKLRLVVV
ncbi:TPA: hypothetical protein N0F65_007114 [Lagenidium giganteum]|uniref:COMM domain-containing protein n=1 Tax=Lagenidium giganteum TaxID=4803 RepID=A0AAV2YQX5_9STRA|nr:TPA: hypothetical protein N0F65_007114 [Lagenidium giganteum]